MCIFWKQTVSLPPGYAISDLQNFQKVSVNKKLSETRSLFFLAGMKSQWHEGGRRILLGDNTDGGAIMLRPIKFHCTSDQASTGLPSIYLHTRSWPCVAYTQFRLALDLPKHNYCISLGVSLVVLDIVKRKYFQDVNKKNRHYAWFHTSGAVSGFRSSEMLRSIDLIGKCWRFGTTNLCHLQGLNRSFPEHL